MENRLALLRPSPHAHARLNPLGNSQHQRPARIGFLIAKLLVVDLDVYEGPIDVLLALAREQKVDLKQISILKLADQYLAFIQRAKERAERFQLEIAADYLVMAAWLAFLKSRLLLPAPPEVAEIGRAHV